MGSYQHLYDEPILIGHPIDPGKNLMHDGITINEVKGIDILVGIYLFNFLLQ